MSKRTANGSTTHLQNGTTATKRKLALLAKGADSKEKHEGFLTTAASFVVAHQIGLPMTFISLISLLHVLQVPVARKFLYLSYETSPGSGQYDVGRDDIYFVSFWVLAFTAIRDAIMWYFLRPFARWNGVRTEKKLVRFAEQGWSFLYYMVFWTLGMYIMYHSPHWFNTSYYWIDYPHKPIGQLAKWYYLVQFAFWVQQVFVLNIEERRKDYPAMLTHHIVTCILISSSYFTNFTRIGNAVLCTMDFSDIVLSLAKLLNYLNMRTICDIMFGVFLVSWLVTRHIIFGIIIWATYAEPERYMDMKWEPELGKYFTPFTKSLYLALFIMLQIVIIFWFFMILRVALKVIRGSGAEDTRSDSEDEEPVESVQPAKYSNGKKHE